MLKQGVDVMSTSHEDITLIKYSSQKEDIFRRIKENIGLLGDSAWQNRCSNHVRYQMGDKGRRPGCRYGDEGKNSRHFVSNEQFRYLYGIILGELLLEHANNLS